MASCGRVHDHTVRNIYVVARADADMRVQHDPGEAAVLVRVEHRPLRFISVAHHGNPGFSAQVQVPKLVAGRGSGDQQVFRIPAVRVAAKGWIGGAGYIRLGA